MDEGGIPNNSFFDPSQSENSIELHLAEDIFALFNDTNDKLIFNTILAQTHAIFKENTNDIPRGKLYVDLIADITLIIVLFFTFANLIASM